jgi:SOS-response transcriptional repressor LexA
MSPAQRDVFLIVDEYWKRYGCSPTLREIAYLRGKMGMRNTQRLVDRLVELGVLKKVSRRGRTIRPVYINFRNLE